ncbi:MAG TPA: permease prefix domain 1-containing protein [Acidimicrobiia bacterium]|nr:permease prefix domain 1-containing protein [Acidimicrobiia bacterium]
MADHAMIDAYLGSLRREMGRIAQAEAILDEVTDHLLEAVAANLRSGLDGPEAEARVLSEFGDPRLVGRALASTTTGGIAVPTNFTRRSGVFLIVSSALWLASFAFLYASDVADRSGPWEGTPQNLFLAAQSLLIAAAATLFVGVVGLVRRHGGMMGIAGRVATLLAILLVLAAPVAWATGLWSTILAALGLALLIGVGKATLAPRAAGTMIAIGAVATSALFWWFEVRMDPGSDALFGGWVVLALFVAFGLMSTGLATVGLWLRSERPADVPASGVPA